jgi:hypothetical protein
VCLLRAVFDVICYFFGVVCKRYPQAHLLGNETGYNNYKETDNRPDYYGQYSELHEAHADQAENAVYVPAEEDRGKQAAAGSDYAYQCAKPFPRRFAVFQRRRRSL